MKAAAPLFSIIVLLTACNQNTETSNEHPTKKQIEGTWKLLTGTLIEKGNTTVTDYTKGASFIKIINDSHFAFLSHDTNHGKDSTASFTLYSFPSETNFSNGNINVW